VSDDTDAWLRCFDACAQFSGNVDTESYNIERKKHIAAVEQTVQNKVVAYFCSSAISFIYY